MRPGAPTRRSQPVSDSVANLANNQPYSEPTPPQYRAPGAPPLGPDGSAGQPMDGARALDALVWAQGKPAIAAERLGLQSADSLLAAIVLDDALQDRLRTVMRSFALIRLLGVAESLEDILMERIEQLDNASIAKLFTNVLQLADLMTRGSNAAGATSNVDPREALLKQLPPEIRGALRVISSNTMDEAILNDDREGVA